ncbi:MAG TPA: BatA domain-containing protein, partial [Ferruginibacter sp.]|nr:BatA domain-containing protein [Ferruginibacter sp.]
MLFSYFKNIVFGQPWFFALLLIAPVLIYWYAYKAGKQQGAITISDTSAPGLSSWKSGLRHLPFILRLLALAFIIAAMARPQTMYEEQNAEGEGVDIVL